MAKSNYEIYAEEKQPKIMQQTVTFEQCLNVLKEHKNIYHPDIIIDQMEFVASVFGLQFNEVNRAVEGKEHWCL